MMNINYLVDRAKHISGGVLSEGVWLEIISMFLGEVNAHLEQDWGYLRGANLWSITESDPIIGFVLDCNLYKVVGLGGVPFYFTELNVANRVGEMCVWADAVDLKSESFLAVVLRSGARYVVEGSERLSRHPVDYVKIGPCEYLEEEGT
jgi:hypothetical protein